MLLTLWSVKGGSGTSTVAVTKSAGLSAVSVSTGPASDDDQAAFTVASPIS